MSILVFLEHHEDELQKGSLSVLSKAASLGAGDVYGVVAVSDAINEPRYPSLKGIMGAKKKPQETLSGADLGLDAGALGEQGSGTTVLALSDPPPRGDTTKIEDDGNAAAQIVDFLAEKRLL